MQQTTNDAPLLLGFQGWPKPAWLESYFPEDLPDDWQFAYYTNEASCLLLPADDWLALDADEVEDWCDNAPEHFRFYLQQATDIDTQQLEPFMPCLGVVLVADKSQCTANVPCLYPADIFRCDSTNIIVPCKTKFIRTCMSFHHCTLPLNQRYS